MVFRPQGWVLKGVNAEEEGDAGEINYNYNICKSKGHCPSQKGGEREGGSQTVKRYARSVVSLFTYERYSIIQ